MGYRLARGMCPSCGTSVLLYLVGTIRQHTAGHPGVRWTENRTLCPGSGQKPTPSS